MSAGHNGSFAVSTRVASYTIARCSEILWRAARNRLDSAWVEETIDVWSRTLVAMADIHIEVTGVTPNWSQPFVVMSNHQSHYDIPVLFQTVKARRLRMVTKKELFRIPIFGGALRQTGFVEIDRSKRESAIASLKQAAEKVHSGTSVWIAPEGTRSRTGQIGPFKKGGFHLASAAQVPILPVAISGTMRVLPAGSLHIRRGEHVKVEMGRPIGTLGRPIEGLMDEVREFLQARAAAAAS